MITVIWGNIDPNITCETRVILFLEIILRIQQIRLFYVGQRFNEDIFFMEIVVVILVREWVLNMLDS